MFESISIQLKFILPVLGFDELRLFLLAEEKRPENKVVYLCPHKATVRVFRAFDNRFASHIERRVDDDRAAGDFLKGPYDVMENRIRFLVDRLDARGIIYMSHSWNL